MKVLLTGSAGFIGGAVRDALEARGDEVVGVDVMLAQAHGPAEAPEGTHRLDVRDAAAWGALLDGTDVVCHQAAVVGAGVRVGDLPDYAGHNDLGTAALLAAMHDARVARLVLAEQDLPRVFDLAWQGSPARTAPSGQEPGSGAGLGLAIVRGIVEAHRGTVEVANQPAGCRFRVLLPA